MPTVAVLGTGTIGTRHLECLDVLSRLTPVKAMAVPLRAKRQQELRDRGTLVAASLKAAREQGATHCIVATETGRHAKDVHSALALGLHVLVEKPMAVTAAEAASIQQHAQTVRKNTTGRFGQLYVGCVLRFSSSLSAFREALPRVGPLHVVQIVCQSYLPDWRPQRAYRESYSARADEGGVLRDLIHEIDAAGWLFGWPAAVQARLRNLNRLGIQAEEVAELQWLTPDGANLAITLDYLTKPPRRSMTACGVEGTLVWDGIANTATWATTNGPVPIDVAPQTRDAMFIAQAEAFLRACDGHRDGRLATAEDGVRALAVCDAAQRASATGRETAISYP